jgi:outer membrane protein assembly factor BamB
MSRLPLRSAFRRLVLACLATAGLSLPAAAQAPAVLPKQQNLEKYGLELQWWGQAILDPAVDTVRYVSVDEEIVYVQSTEGILTTFNGESGKRLWSQLLGGPSQISLPIATNEREAFVAIGLQLFGVNKFTGELEWEIRLGHHPSTSPDADNDHLYIGMVDGALFCYDLNKIRTLWEAGKLPAWSASTYLWRHKAPLEISSPPVSDGKTVVFASRSGTLYSVGCRDHELKFQFETDASIETPIGYGAGSLFVASEDTRLYCLNRETGIRRWTFTAGVPIRQQPHVVGSSVFVAPSKDGVYCLVAASGVIRWHQPLADEFLAANDKYVFATDRLHNVLMLSHEDGSVLGEAPLRGYTVKVANDRTDRLYLASPDGLIVCIRDKAQEFPLYHKYPERRPILPELAPDEPAEAPAQ